MHPNPLSCQCMRNQPVTAKRTIYNPENAILQYDRTESSHNHTQLISWIYNYCIHRCFVDFIIFHHISSVHSPPPWPVLPVADDFPPLRGLVPRGNPGLAITRGTPPHRLGFWRSRSIWGKRCHLFSCSLIWNDWGRELKGFSCFFVDARTLSWAHARRPAGRIQSKGAWTRTNSIRSSGLAHLCMGRGLVPSVLNFPFVHACASRRDHSRDFCLATPQGGHREKKEKWKNTI